MTEQRLEKLFKQHYRRMYRLATVFLHDDAESKDVVHDIFARLLDGHSDLKEETIESYLLTSVRNRCLNVIRSRRIQERVEKLYLLDLETTITPTNHLEEELKTLHRGIGQLQPLVCRDIIVHE
ncbi:MAG: sigma-70 family RNA polymerase sigma factor [Prevotella sp.]|nr:sigma-70 family RNA polymerase sigma factor [Prevotella sp.]